MRVKEYKNKQNNNERHATRLFHHHVGLPTPFTIFTKIGRVAETRDVFTLAKFQINWFINVALVSGWSLLF